MTEKRAREDDDSNNGVCIVFANANELARNPIPSDLVSWDAQYALEGVLKRHRKLFRTRSVWILGPLTLAQTRALSAYDYKYFDTRDALLAVL